MCVCVCNSTHVCLCVFHRSKKADEVNECPRETTPGEEEVVGGQAEEK